MHAVISLVTAISYSDTKRMEGTTDFTPHTHTPADFTPHTLLQISQNREMLASHLCQQVLIADHTACQNTH